MKSPKLLALGILVAVPSAFAQGLYQQNFESSPVGSATSTPGSFTSLDDIQGSGWQIQGGSDGAANGSISVTGGVNNSGVGGSRSLYGTWDLSGGANYTWNQFTFYGVGGAGAGVGLEDIQVSIDILISGSDNNTPLTLLLRQEAANVERSFTPTLANDQFTHVEFTLDETTGGDFDPAAPFWFRISHGNGGFGFDANNTIQIDNISISVVPEPTSAALLALGVAGAAMFRRRR